MASFGLGRNSVKRTALVSQARFISDQPVARGDRIGRQHDLFRPRQISEPSLADGQRELKKTAEEKEDEVQVAVIRSHIDQTSELEGAQYEALFEVLGLPLDQRKNILAKVKQLHEGAAAVNYDLQKLNTARSDFDRSMQQLLGPEKFRAYKEFELKKPANREIELVSSYLSTQSASMDGQTKNMVFDAIYANQATTTELWHGPYDPMPHTLFGLAIPPYLESEIGRIQRNSSMMIQSLAPVLPGETIAMLQDYYSNKIRSLQDDIARAFRTPEQIKEWIRQMEEEDRRSGR